MSGKGWVVGIWIALLLAESRQSCGIHGSIRSSLPTTNCLPCRIRRTRSTFSYCRARQHGTIREHPAASTKPEDTGSPTHRETKNITNRLARVATRRPDDRKRSCVRGNLTEMEAIERSGWTFLQRYVADGRFEDVKASCRFLRRLDQGCCFKVLLEGGADTQTADDRGRTPLHLAAINGNRRIAEVRFVPFGHLQWRSNVQGALETWCGDRCN